ncbi:MAG TPA: hypothetical protein VMT24_08550 [Aggregatilineaceae bacterium]|jgi:hypothetical protein|nr:hypothetical protein [Aggregatilineaceae bacterium]
MAWTTPKTWNVDELLTAANLNTHLRDNLNALKAPPTDHYECDEASEYTTTSTSFVDVDGTNLALTITTSGGDVLVHFHASVVHTNNGKIFFDMTLDGSRISRDDGFLGGYVSNAGAGNTASSWMSFTRLVTGVAAGEHTFVLQWRTTASTAKLFAGATTGQDVHPQFWAREVS